MYDPDKQRLEAQPTLEDVFQLERTIEALPEVGLKDLGGNERIAVNRYPDGRLHSEGTVISHIALSQRVGDGARYATTMSYIILRDGDETSTRIIKRPPFEVGRGIDPSDAETVRAEVNRVSTALAEYDSARAMGMFDVTADEVRELTDLIQRVFAPHDA